MKIHAYSVETEGGTTLGDVIEALSQREVPDRLIEGAATDFRLDNVQQDETYWYLDFTKIRYQHGPGRASRTAPVTGFDLDEDEGFGEETAAIFDPASGFLIVQYNHHGPRAGSIENYFSTFADHLFGGDEVSGFSFGIVLKQNAFAELQAKQLIRSIEFDVHVPGLNVSQREQGLALGAVARNPLPGGTQTVRMKMSAGPERNSTLDHEAAIREVRSWLNKGDVSRIRASAKDDENTPQEEIDLLNARLERDVQVRPGQDRRYPVNERWRALTQAYSYWRDNDYI